jgi:hypothetical protein
LSKVSDVIYFWWACSIFEVPAEVRHNGKLSPPTRFTENIHHQNGTSSIFRIVMHCGAIENF